MEVILGYGYVRSGWTLAIMIGFLVGVVYQEFGVSERVIPEVEWKLAKG
jgi:hypothetical protein